MRRVAGITAAVAAAGALAALIVLHLAPVRHRALAWVIAQLEARYGLTLSADALHYNLVTGTATLTGVRLAARGMESEPFFAAARVTADVPLAAYAGRLILDDVEVTGGRVAILTDEQGRSNLPPASGRPPPDDPRSLALRGLTLDTLDFLYDNRVRRLRIAATGVSAALEHRSVRVFDGVTGAFAIGGGIDLQWRDRSLRIAPIDTRLAFDGQDVSLQDLPLDTSLGRLAVSGRISRVLDRPALELTFEGEADVARAATWAPPPMEVSGAARVRGSVVGPASSIEIAVRFDADALRVGAESNLTAGGEIHIDTARVTGNRLMVSPASGGQIDATFELPIADEPFTSAGAWQDVDARVFLRALELGVPNVAARLDGRARYASGPRRALAVEADATGFAEPDTTPVSGRVTASIDGAAWRVEHALRSGGVTSAGQTSGRLAAGNFGGSSLTGELRVNAASLAAADRAAAPHGFRVPAAVRDAAGALEAAVALDGSIGSPRARVETVAPALDVPAIGLARLEAVAELDASRVHVSPLTLVRGTAEVTAELTVDLDARTLEGTAHLAAPDARDVQQAVPEAVRAEGALTADAIITGTMAEPVVDATLSSPALTFAGEPFGPMAARARVTSGGVELPSAGLEKDAGRLQLSGRYGFDGRYTVQAEAIDLALSREMADGVPSRAIVNGAFGGSGTLEDPAGEGRFTFAVSGGVAGDLVGEGVLDVRLAGGRANLSAHVPSLGAFARGAVELASPFAYRTVALVNGVDLARLAPLTRARPGSMEGTFTVTAAIDGTLAGEPAAAIEANLQQLDLQVDGVPVRLTEPATVTWRRGELAVRDLSASVGTGTVTAGGTWAGHDRVRLQGRFDGELAQVATIAGAFGLDTGVAAAGRLSLELRATGPVEQLAASLTLVDGRLDIAEGVEVTGLGVRADLQGESLVVPSISGHVAAINASGDFTASGRLTVPGFDPRRASGRISVDTAAFDTAGVNVVPTRPSVITIADGVFTMEDVVWEAAGSTIAVDGHVDASRVPPALDLGVTGVAILRVLSAFVPALAIDGRADVNVRVGGTTRSPDLSGRIALDNAQVALAVPRLLVSELSGPIHLEGNRVVLGGLTGQANGGRLTLDGGVVLDGLRIADGEIFAQAAGMALEYPRGLRSEVDALLTYDLGEPAPTLRGDVLVQRSAYTEPISLAALARNAGSSSTPSPLARRSLLDELRLNITISTVEDVRVDNNYGRFEGSAQLRLVGTAGSPGMTGQVTLREGGRVYAAGRTFTLNRGTVSFTNLNRIEPDLDIQAETRLAGQGNVTMTVQGTPDRLSFDLASETEGSDEEIASALLGGTQTSTSALALLSSDFLGVTGQQLGLDQLRLDRGDVVRDEFREDPSVLSQDEEDPVTRLTLSKRIRENVEFTVSQSLRENGKATFVVSYFPVPNFELRAISRDDSAFGAGIRHQVIFGGGAAAQTAPVRAQPEIAAVRFEGAFAPVPESDLRRVVDLDPGDTFDYYRWQRDLDALDRLFVERGYYQARVRGRREERGDGVIDVVYAVERGPRTVIEVRGFDLPDSDLDQLRIAWNRSVFDRFVVEEAEARAERHLVETNHVTGTAEAGVEEAGDVKTLTIRATPGPLASSRRMRFSGNEGISNAHLESVVAAADLRVDGWIDPARLTETLTVFYQQEGYLNARVRVDAPFIDATAGILPVTIDEGPRALIQGVRISGASEARQAEADSAVNLPAGQPYTQAAVEAARRRLERAYRTSGYNSVEVSASATPDEAASSVEVAFTVREGPRQILTEVVTTGTTRTRQGVVSRALRLPVGEPVNLEEWSLARKRLFDTNVFRSVDVQAVPLGEPVDGVQQVQALVTVEEYRPWRLRYGLQVDRERETDGEDGRIENNLGAIAELRNQNILGRAVTGGVALRIERDFQRANTFLQTASFFTLPVRSGVFLYASRENFRDDGDLFAVTDVQGVSVEQRWRRRLGFEITYGYRFETNHTYDPDPFPGDDFPLDVTANLGRLNAAFLFDRRDDPVNARRGTFSSASVERSARWLGSDVTYGRLLAQQHGFVSVGPLVLAGRVIAGRGFGADDLLLGDRFYAGGATTVRGYANNGLGPRDLFGSPRGGSEMLVLNQELRFPVYRWVGAVAFLDVGNVFDEMSPFAWRRLKVGYGGGLRLDSPVGLLRLDVGIPGSRLDGAARVPNRLDSARWYFGIGHVF